MNDFKKKIEEAFANAEELAKSNSTIPPMPLRPSMPGFCSKPDTTLYIFAGCTVQNYKVYIGGKFARDLTAVEKKQLDDFSKTVSQPQNSGNSTNIPNASKPAFDTSKLNLDFCTEF
uniref:Pepsin inhibitor-3-like repeated domain-containing protein n=1 Tax=Panagrolaimus sp. JU765 TaxID=591449 RepID=A0AC34QM17_9BILA